jgi:nucleoside-diphosphate-sugar epimerase
VESVLGRNLFGPTVEKGRVLWVGDLDQPLGPMFIDDFAYGLAELGEHDAALGEVWHLPTPAPTTARQLLKLVSAQVQRPVRAVRLDARSARVLGLVWSVAREGAEMLYQFRQPHWVDATKYRTAFTAEQVTPYEQGVEQTLRWYRNNPSRSVVAIGR